MYLLVIRNGEKQQTEANRGRDDFDGGREDRYIIQPIGKDKSKKCGSERRNLNPE